MPDKKERFSNRARLALSLAQEEAERLKDSTIKTEHLLLGLLHDKESTSAKTLYDLGFELDHVRALVDQLTVVSTGTPFDLSNGVKKVLELAVDEARRMGNHQIGTAHLLLGLVKLSENVTKEVLHRQGVTPRDIRLQLSMTGWNSEASKHFNRDYPWVKLSQLRVFLHRIFKRFFIA